MKNIRMRVEFDGSRYLGWQRLGDSDNTIQAKLESILYKMTSQKVNIIGSSRTDRGVHSRGLICNFHLDTSMEVDQIEDYIDRYLPDDIVVHDLEEVEERFHSRYNAQSKSYRYTIDNGNYQDVFTRRYTSHEPSKLDISLMQEAGDLLIGRFDFSAYTTMKSKKKSKIRSLYKIEISKEGNYIYMDFNGEGFLHNMIRIIVGSLIRVGLEEIPPSLVGDILESKTRSLAGPMAEAKGLCLMKVDF